MKKLATIFLMLTLLVSFVWAENTSQAVKRVQWSREMIKLSQPEQVKIQSKVQNALRSNSDRGKMMQVYMGKTHHERKSHKTNSHLQVFNNQMSFQRAQKSLSKFAPSKTDIMMPMDTLTLFPGVPDTINYIAGESFVFQILTGDTVVLEFWVDDGDSVFGGNDLFVDLSGDDGDEIKVWDGAEFDETPPGDGIFQKTLNTMSFGDEGSPEPFFGLQNCIVYVSGWSTAIPIMFEGVAFVGAPDENTSIEGTVMVENPPEKSVGSYPAVDVVVWVAKMPADTIWEDWEPEAVFLTKTDQNGYYKIGIFDQYQGDFIIGVEDIWNQYPGYYPDPYGIDVSILGQVTGFDFVLTVGKETIYGAVQDENGQGVGGVTINAHGDYGETEVVTNSDGSFEIPAMPGWWEVEIEEDDIYGQYMIPWSKELEVFENGDHPVNFTLYSLDASFTGYVGTSAGDPMADVEMYTDVWLGIDVGYHNWAYTDESGNYELRVSTALQGIPFDNGWGGVDTSSYWVNAWSDDVLFMPDSYSDVYAPAAGLDFTAIIPDASLSGTVYDANDNNPLYDAQVHVYQLMSPVKGPAGLPGLDLWAFTDENGYYEIPLVGEPYPGVPYMIEVYWPYEWRPSVVDSMNVLSGNHYNRDYYISEPVTEGVVEGYVFDENGYGIANAHVELYNWNQYFEIYTDGSGYFRLEHIPFDWYSATANADGYDPYNIDNIWVGDQPTYLEFWMGSIVGDILLDGFVVDESNSPIPGALMMLFNWEFYEPFTLFTDDSGHFELNVKPGWYDFQVGANGFGAFNQGFEIQNDTTLMVTLTGFPMIADTLQGNVVDDGDNPLRKVFVYAELYDYENDIVEYMGYTYTDINGHYEIALPAGEVDMMFSKSGFNPEWRTFDWPNNSPEDPIMMWPEMHVFGPELIDVIDVPEDNGKQVRLTWKRAEGLEGSVKEYQIWRAIQPFNDMNPSPEIPYDWDYVTTVPVHPEMDIYNVVVPTLYDAVGDDIYWTGFVVTAIGWDSWSYWNSNMLAGFSVDNLSPEIPGGLNAVGDGANITLQWEPVTNEKIKYYSVYRKTASTEFEVVGYSTTAEYVDESVSTSESYEYSVTATDFGLNESGKSEPVYVAALAVDDVSEIPTEFALKPNYPNPFNPETTIEFALPKTSKVTMSIYNLTGQLVRELVRSEYSAGYHRVIWNGLDSRGNMVGSGVYIYTLKADNFSQTRKMILIR